MNLLPKQSERQSSIDLLKSENTAISNTLNLDLNYLIDKPGDATKFASVEERNGDDVLVDIADEVMIDGGSNSDDGANPACVSVAAVEDGHVSPEIKILECKKVDLKISDVLVDLESIKPGTVAPLTVLDEKNGISVTLHFAKDKPREDVNVVVVTSVSKNELPLTNYLFQAVVPKVKYLVDF